MRHAYKEWKKYIQELVRKTGNNEIVWTNRRILFKSILKRRSARECELDASDPEHGCYEHVHL